MKKFIGYELVTVRAWVREGNKIFLLTEGNQKFEYFGTSSLSEVWLKARKGRTLYVGLVGSIEEPGCVLVTDLVN